MLDDNVILTERRAQLREIAIAAIAPSPYQPRRHFNEESIEGLAKTFRHMGILEPLCVRPKPDKPNHYELVAGERRWRAAKLVGLDTVPCLISHYSNEEAAQASLVENTSREDLDPISKAHAMKRLVKEFHYTQEELAEILGISRSAVSNQLRLLNLDMRLQRWMEQGDMSEGHGKVLAGLELEQQYAIAYKCMAHGWSARMLERTVNEFKAGKPVAGQVALEERVIEAKEAARMLAQIFNCKTDVQIKANGQGYFQLKFRGDAELKSLNEKIEVIVSQKP